MSTLLTSGGNGGGNYTPHPEGQFMAVCCDIFTKVKPNKYKGQKGNNGKIDERDTITSLCVSFLTDKMIEIDGKMKPRYASFWATATLGTTDYPSNLRKFIQGWIPTLKDADLETFDADTLIGKGAYLTIRHSEAGPDGKVWANITGAMMPPKGMPVPLIPSDFVRHQDKDAAPAQQAAPASGPGGEGAFPDLARYGDASSPF